ncbi:hypothetical protein LWI29_034940 [Acer saccharum]|uniref:Uncharacterized protein n=1 Tax=Acer saccharum TaxID=4024 RepID=A0AA39SGD1_ACESA|nr:hypothetical protein LWI29_034940 [Acer saccharum]
MFLEQSRSWGTSSVVNDPSSNLLVTLVINREKIEQLKHWIATQSENDQELEQIRITTYVVTCAFMWVNLTKLQEKINGSLHDDTCYNFISVADCRERFEFSMIPGTYFGNCLAYFFVSAKRRELMEDSGIVVAAKTIGRKLSELGKGTFVGAENWVSELEKVVRNGRLVSHLFPWYQKMAAQAISTLRVIDQSQVAPPPVNRSKSEDLTSLSLPYHNKDLVKDPKGLSSIFLKHSRSSGNNYVENDDPSGNVLVTLVINREKIEQLKHWIATQSENDQELSQIRITTYVVTCAFMWVNLMKLKEKISGNIDDDAVYYFGSLADCRERFEFSIIPRTYFGNCVMYFVVSAKRSELMAESGIVVAAKFIGRKLCELGKGVLAEIDNISVSAGAEKAMKNGRVVSVAGSPKFRVDVKTLQSLVPKLPFIRPSSSSNTTYVAPVMAVQFTVFANSGISVGVTSNHVVGDGRSINHFMKSWASIHKSPQGDHDLITTSSLSLPYCSKNIIEDSDGITSNILKDIQSIGDSGLSGEAPDDDDHVLITLVLKRAEIEKLKHCVKTTQSKNELDQQIHISSFAVTCAFTWVNLMKLHEQINGSPDDDDDVVYHFLALVDCRERVLSEIPANFFGNCLTYILVPAKRSELMGESGIVFAAKAIGRKINEVGKLGAMEDVKTLQSLVPKLPSIRPSSSSNTTHAAPVLAVQFTVFANSGFSVGVTSNHVAGDGRSINHFMKSWASIHKSQQKGQDLITSSLSLPYCSKDIMEDSDVIRSNILKGIQSIGDSGLSGDVPDHDHVLFTLVLKRAEIEKLKHCVKTTRSKNEQDQQIFISSFAVTCAFTWVNLMKLHEQINGSPDDDDDVVYHFLAPVDCRERVLSEIPATYFGNCLTSVVVPVKRRELMGENGIVFAAKAIGRKTNEADVKTLQSLVPKLPFIRPSSSSNTTHAAPVLAVQFTVFANSGISVGVTSNHVAGDGRSINHFMKSWAFIHKSQQKGQDLITSSLSLPYCSKDIMEDSDVITSNILKGIQSIGDSGLSGDVPDHDHVLITLVLKRAEIEKLKHCVKTTQSKNEQDQQIFISSFAVTCAFTWVNLMKLHEQINGSPDDDDDVVYHFLAPVDCRERVLSDIPATYFGNCLTFIVVPVKRRELMGESGIVFAAKAIGRKTNEADVKTLQSLVPKLPFIRPSSSSNTTHAAPVLAVQFTVFANSGISVGVTSNHVAGDGRSINHFMKSWASIHKSQQKGQDLITSSLSLPYCSKDIMEDSDVIRSNILKGIQSIGDSGLSGDVPDHDHVLFTLVLKRAEIEKLKHCVKTTRSKNEQDQQIFISSFAVTCAFMWVNLMKLHEQINGSPDDDDDVVYHFLALVDCRERVLSEIPATYFGNCLTSVAVPVKRRQLMGENGIVFAAKAIGRKTNEADVKTLQSLVPKLPSIRPSSSSNTTHAAPVLAVQFTVFANSGFSVGVTSNHVAGDGRSINHFMKSWASIHKSQQKGQDLITSSLSLPYCSKDIMEDSDVIRSNILKGIQSIGDSGLSGDVPDHDHVLITLVLKRAEIEKLKHCVKTTQSKNELDQQIFISSFAVTCAFTWVNLMKLHEQINGSPDDDDDVVYHFLAPVDCRERVLSDIPATYFGNCLTSIVVPVKRRELMGESGIVFAAKAIGRKTNEAVVIFLKNPESIGGGGTPHVGSSPT